MNGQIIGGACIKWDNKKLENITRIICHSLEQQQQKITQYVGLNTAQIQNLTKGQKEDLNNKGPLCI